VSNNSYRHERLLATLRVEYEERFPESKRAHERARTVLIDGGNHGARSFDPYPFFVCEAKGAHVITLERHRLIDFWQGHYANILGHNPPLVRDALVAELQRGAGLHTGMLEERQTEYSRLLVEITGAERVRLTTAGTLATMYAIMLARGYTGRRLVVKMAGGWHGASPMALKGIGRGAGGFDAVDSAGVPQTTADEVVVIPFNDVDTLHKLFRSLGDRIACLIFEPCLGGAGFIPATRAFMGAARRLTEQYGALLILDEVITGFRFCAGGVQRLYGVRPDLSTYGKVIGGGMPVSAVAGREDVMALAGDGAKNRVWFNGGTFSAHPLSLRAGQVMIEYLRDHEDVIYPALAAKGDALRQGIEKAFADRGVLARCTGYSNDAIPGGSLASVYFPERDDAECGDTRIASFRTPRSAEDMTDPRLTDIRLREQGLKLGLLLHGVNVVHGLGALSAAHTDEDLARVFEACDAFAKRLNE
jgi:glutamate-1-semialdehyde 2,1-aminomutase